MTFTSARLALRAALSELSSSAIPDDAYVAYFLNEFGESLVFVQPVGRDIATLLHSDNDWEPVTVRISPSGDADLACPTYCVEDENGDGFMLDGIERGWVVTCMDASAAWRLKTSASASA